MPTLHKNKHNFNSKTTALTVVATLSPPTTTPTASPKKVYFVTGTTHGIGYETFRSLYVTLNDVEFVLANRDVARMDQLIKDTKPVGRGNVVHNLKLDLSSFESIKECNEQHLKLGLTQGIYRMILNAGIFKFPYTETVEGYESHFGINHLGHFYLVSLLRPQLIQGGSETDFSRVIVVASHSHYTSDIKNDTEFAGKGYCYGKDKKYPTSKVTQLPYANSKLCNVLFSNELNRQFTNNDNVRSYSLHPATMVNSNLGNNSIVTKMLFGVLQFFTRSIQQAASTTCYLSEVKSVDFEGGEVGGGYYDECNEKAMSRVARDDEVVAGRLWKFSVDAIEEFEAKEAGKGGSDKI